ncbi:MAG: hypothetical protein LBR00_01155, partial [Clostridiales Family XIII bacterium]|nr:hypothetical protein [Clostridiales Family XIII bacterium]
MDKTLLFVWILGRNPHKQGVFVHEIGVFPENSTQITKICPQPLRLPVSMVRVRQVAAPRGWRAAAGQWDPSAMAGQGKRAAMAWQGWRAAAGARTCSDSSGAELRVDKNLLFVWILGRNPHK